MNNFHSNAPDLRKCITLSGLCCFVRRSFCSEQAWKWICLCTIGGIILTREGQITQTKYYHSTLSITNVTWSNSSLWDEYFKTMTVNSKESVQIKPCVEVCKVVRHEVCPVTCHQDTEEGLRCSSTLFITPTLNFVSIHDSKFHQNLSTYEWNYCTCTDACTFILLWNTTENCCK